MNKLEPGDMRRIRKAIRRAYVEAFDMVHEARIAKRDPRA